MNQQSNQ